MYLPRFPAVQQHESNYFSLCAACYDAAAVAAALFCDSHGQCLCVVCASVYVCAAIGTQHDQEEQELLCRSTRSLAATKAVYSSGLWEVRKVWLIAPFQVQFHGLAQVMNGTKQRANGTPLLGIVGQGL